LPSTPGVELEVLPTEVAADFLFVRLHKGLRPERRHERQSCFGTFLRHCFLQDLSSSEVSERWAFQMFDEPW